MTAQAEISALKTLPLLPYLDQNGALDEELQKKIGVYAIYDQAKILQFVGYSRDIHTSLKQHLVRQTPNCYWLKCQIITKPNRTWLEETRQAWISENGEVPPGNEPDEKSWIQAIDTKFAMTEEEKAQYELSDELQQIKILKNVARRVQKDIEKQLSDRQVNVEIRFNPKLKEQGLLDLK